MDLRYIALLVAGLNVFTCTTWASVEVSMEDRVEVSLNNQAKIACMYSLSEKAMMITWSKKLPGRDRSKRIYYSTSDNEFIDYDYTGRISVNHSYDPSESRGSVILTISNVQLSDESEYICTVHNVSKDHGEGHTWLQVFNSPSFPVIVGTHNGISVTEVQPSKIADCTVNNAYPRPTITWYKNKFPLQPSDDVKIIVKLIKNPSGLFTVESELFLKVAREDEDAEVYCEVNYFAPGAMKMMESTVINIMVYYPTTMITMMIDPPAGLLKEGDTVSIRCEGDGIPQPIFSFVREEVGGDKDLLGLDNGLLVLDNVTRSDSGTYVCISHDLDTFDEVKNSIQIQIHYLDEIVVIPEKRVLDQGEDLTLTCNALSSLPTQTAWYKGEIQLEEKHVLKLHNASSDTAGMYLCEVTVSSLPELQKQKSVQINVRGKPRITGDITVGPKNRADHSVNLTCYAEGYPIPTIIWDLSERRTRKPLPLQNAELQKTSAGVLSMISVKATSEFTADCSASNEFGTDVVSRHVTTFAQGTTGTTTAPHAKATGITVPPKQQQQRGGSGVTIAVIIISLLLLVILGIFLYFLFKKGKLPCGRSGKQDFTKEQASKDDEIKSGKSEEAVLLRGVNGDKKSPTE